MRLYSLLCILLLTSFSRAASFDKPLSTKSVDLGPSKYSSGARARLKCYFFADFMVKEVDLGEKGASRLAILPGAKSGVTRCTQAREKSELVVNPDDWSGYFKGVKNGLVFFDADDGVNGGMGFAVYDARSGKKMFSDSAAGAIAFSERADTPVVITYARVVEVKCVLPKDPSGCWNRISRDLGLNSSGMPDCNAGYEKSAQELAKGRCQAQNADNRQCREKEIALARQQTSDAPSVVVYPVEVTLDAKPAVRPVAGELRCWPAD